MELIHQLDTATLAFVTGLAGFLLAGTMVGIRLVGMRNPALRYWAIAGLAAGVGHLLAHLALTFHVAMPQRASLGLANAMVTLVHVSLLAGVRAFLGKPPRALLLLPLAALTASAGYLMPDAWADMRVRIVVLASMYFALNATAGVMLWRSGRARHERFQSVAAFAFLFNAGVLVVRIAHALWRHTPDATFAREPFQTLVYVFGLVFISVLTLGLALLMFRNKELELRRLVHRDPLTGLFNRRSLFEHGAREQARCERYAAPLSLVMLDIDGFKSVNDTYGHGAGDDVICETAARVALSLRDVDAAFRLGGEEFLILLPSTSLDAAVAVAERVRQAVSETPMAPIGRVVTASFGVTELDRGYEDWEKAMRRADSALYRAKDEGRDRVFAMSAPTHAGRAAPAETVPDVP